MLVGKSSPNRFIIRTTIILTITGLLQLNLNNKIAQESAAAIKVPQQADLKLKPKFFGDKGK